MMILVAGGAGYLGSKLCRKLLDEGKQVRIMDNMRRQRYCSLWHLDGVEFYEGDIRNDNDLERCLNGVETVFCLADLTNAGKSFERREETREINYEGVLNLFETAADSGVEDFIYTSSASVYGNTPGLVDEEFDCGPISPYGKYKLKAEKEMLDRKTRMNTVALRLGTVFGYSQGMRFDTVVNYFTYLAAQGRALTVHESALEEYRPYVDVRDVTRAYIFALENSEEMAGGRYNIVHANMQMGDVVEALSDVFPGLEKGYVENPTENKVSYRISGERIKELGFETRHDMRNGIKTVKESFQDIEPV